MPRPFNASTCLLVGAASALLLGCSGSGTSGPSAPAGSASGGSASGGGGSSSIGGYETSGGVVGIAGTNSFAGISGTGTGGASGGSNGGGSAGAAGTAGGGTNGGAAAGGSGGGSGNCAGLLLCEDFESYTAAPGMPWTVRKNAQGNVTIDGAQHKSGTKAAKFTTTGAMDYQQAYISLDKIFPVANNAFYGRMLIYTTKAPNDGVHWTNIQGEGPAAMGIARADVRYGGQHQQSLMANYDSSGPKSDCWQHSQTKMPEGKWACMEWYFEGATNTQKFWLDGKAIDDLTVVGQGQGCIAHDTADKWLFPSFSRLYLGFESYQHDDPREVWIDDVALSTTKIGCPQ
jgi:hypothetical protein